MQAVRENFLYVPMPDPARAAALKACLTLPLRDEKGKVVGSLPAYDETREGHLGIPWWSPDAVPIQESGGVTNRTREGLVLGLKRLEDIRYRPGQEDLINRSVRLLSDALALNRPTSLLIDAPPGYGKTVVLTHLAYLLGRAFCVLVNTTKIMERWEQEIFSAFGVYPTLIGGGQGLLERCPTIGVAMVQTLVSETAKIPKAFWVRYFQRYGTMIADESDTLPTRVFSQAIPMFYSRFRLGCSGTLTRRDGMDKLIRWHFGPVVSVEDTRQPPRAIQVTLPPTVTDQAFTFGKELNRNYGVTLVGKNRSRSGSIARLATALYRKGRRVMILSDRIDQLETIEGGFPKNCLALGLYGSRRDVLQADPGPCVILSTYALGGRGVDIPWVDSVILATPRAAVTQAMGRVMREYPGKRGALVVDLVDGSSRFFSNLAVKRRKEYEAKQVQVYGETLEGLMAKL